MKIITDILNEAQVMVDTDDPQARQKFEKAKRAAQTPGTGDDKMIARTQMKELQKQLQGAMGNERKRIVASIQALKDKIAGRNQPNPEQQQECEIVYIDVMDNILNEAAIRQFKRVGNEIKKRYRCLSGPRQGKLVAHPSGCAGRKDPKKVRNGRKVMRSKKGVIQRKSAISKRKSMSRLVTKMNKRLSGN